MARASNIYIVMKAPSTIIAAFTVKHEAKRVLGDLRDRPMFPDLYVVRVPDGRLASEGRIATAAEFLESK